MSPAPLFPPPPPELERLRFRHVLRYLGPGAIVASVTIGTGELVWASRSGAIFGYAMMWCFLYAGLFKAVQVYTAARHITLTGEHPMQAWRSLPGPRLWFPLLIALPALAIMPIAFSGISEILATYIHRLAGGAPAGPGVGPWEHLEFRYNVWATVLVTGCLALALGSSYAVLERVSLVVLVLMVVSFAAAALVFRPRLPELAAGALVPRIPGYEPWILNDLRYAETFRTRSPWLEIALYLGAVGGGAYDYIGYIGMMRGRGWGRSGEGGTERARLDAAAADPEQVRRARAWTRAPLLDTLLSFASVVLVTFLCATLGTVILHDRQHAIPKGTDLLTAQEGFLTGLHPALSWLYRLGVFLAIIGTLYGAFEVYRHTFMESLRGVAPHWITGRSEPRWGRAVIAYCYVGGLAMIWLPRSLAGDVEQRMTFGSVIGGALSSGLWCFAMLWVDRTRLPAPLRMSRGLRALVSVAGLAMTALGVQTVIVYFS